MQKMFLSFSNLMHQLVGGTVTESDLDSGLFYFGCTRIAALGLPPGASLSLIVADSATNYEQFVSLLVHVLRPALNQAEREDRVAWRAKNSAQTVVQFEALLAKNLVLPSRQRTIREQQEYDTVCHSFGGNPNVAEAFGNYPLEFVL